MQLVFAVCPAGQGESALAPTKSFNGIGGVIGRGASCDWTLPDASRQLSSRHAVVSYRDGRYFLADISSNGTRLAGSGERLREGQEQPIDDGTVFQLGPLNIRARLVSPAAAPDHDGLHTLIPDDAFLELDPVRALDAELQRREESQELSALTIISPEALQWTDHAAADRDHMTVPELVEPTRKVAPSRQLPPQNQGSDPFWSGFAQALGIDLDTLDGPGREVLAIKAAGLLRQMTEGLQQSLSTRSELKHELKLAVTHTPIQSPNPLKDSADASAALEILLGTGQLGQVSAERVVTRAYRDMQAHQVALLVACRAAVRGALAAFAPGHLLLCFERQAKPPLIPRCGTHWRAYQRHYQTLIEDEHLSDRLLGSDFTKAYEEQIRLISTLHRYPG
ncbi:type VI secretion system-associated FHA domain protein TagH [Pseudomonas sp. K2I15]|uniref:type VI secretion system-associated FHA domain protein TagH n=1 Tax=unclassified Pseudomonas TaxID=196821 RepID=UPI000B4D6ECF|nr:type VI secretion system-associated FHA domain protein TagH [Pseudomonas sp. K2I15]OWP70079.1 type VI secretion protein [Pseudomonas sp. K2I15]